MSSITHEKWQEAQIWEKNWWQTHAYQFPVEMLKTDRMARILNIPHSLPNTSVLDVGCGPLSLLLRIPTAFGRSAALDPIDYSYINMEQQYAKMNIRRLIKKGEDLSRDDGFWDQAWCYNCLQHVQDPIKIIHNCLDVCNTFKIFEWMHGVCDGHLWEISQQLIEHAVGSKGGWAYTFRMNGEFCEKEMCGKFYAAEFIIQS